MTSQFTRRLLPGLLAAGALACAPALAGTPMAMDDSTPMSHEHHHHDMDMNMGDSAMQARMEANMHVPVSRSTADYQVPDVTLKDAGGKAVALRKILDDGEPLMLNFIFTSCTTVCPVMSGIFSQVQTKLGRSVRLVSISIDPEYDTPARLRAYGKRFDAGAEWTMLTGSLADSIAVQRAFGAYRGDKMDHLPATFIRAEAGKPWLRIDGLASADDLVQEYRRLVAR